jgi:hypothetical protein
VALAVKVTAVVLTLLTRTVTAVVSSWAKHIGALVHAAAKVSVHVVDGLEPTVTLPAPSFPARVGVVPQALSVGAVPVKCSWPFTVSVASGLVVPMPTFSLNMRLLGRGIGDNYNSGSADAIQ